jgi:hypothetical protein
MDAVSCGLEVFSMEWGCVGGMFCAAAAEIGIDNCDGLGGRDAVNGATARGIAVAAAGGPPVCGGADASSNAGGVGSKLIAACTRDSTPPVT